MYALLFRSRWYALAWALFMAASAVMFTTTGAGAWLTGPQVDPRAREEAREHQFSAWAEDDKPSSPDNLGYDPSSPERLRDGTQPRVTLSDADHRSVPFTQDDADTN